MATESEAAIMSVALALCDEFVDAGVLNRESLASAFAAHAWVLQQQKMPTAAGILEILRQALTDDEKRAYRKKLKEQIGGHPLGTVQ